MESCLEASGGIPQIRDKLRVTSQLYRDHISMSVYERLPTGYLAMVVARKA